MGGILEPFKRRLKGKVRNRIASSLTVSLGLAV